jgi:cation transport regulator ChaC
MLPIRLDDGSTTSAIVAIYEGKNILPIFDQRTLERKICEARGTHGSGPEYLQRVARELDEVGIEDPVVTKLAALVFHRD